MRQRILVIKEVLGERNELAFSLVEPYIKDRLKEGSFVNVHETQGTILKSLLEEEEIWQGEITQQEIDIMFDINSYDKVVYVSQEAAKPSDILVYNPEDLDKNMIFYHIGNMTVKDKYDVKDDVSSVFKTEDIEFNPKELKANKRMWTLVALIPWLIFLLMYLFGYKNISGIPLFIAIVALFVKILRKQKNKEYLAESINVALFALILFSNYQNYSWIANISPVISFMGLVLILIVYKIDLDEI